MALHPTESILRGITDTTQRSGRMPALRALIRTRVSVGLGVCLLLGSSIGLLPTWAGDPGSPAKGLRIAVVDLAAATTEMPEKRSVEAKIQTRMDALNIEVSNRWAEVQRLSREFKDEQNTLSQERLAQRQAEIVGKEREITEYWDKGMIEVKALTTQLTGAFTETIRKAVANMAQQEHYDLVFEKENGRLLYGSEAMDQTKSLVKLIKELNTASPSSSAADRAKGQVFPASDPGK